MKRRKWRGRKYLIPILAAIIFFQAGPWLYSWQSEEPATISGFVEDKKNGETLIGATVQLKGSNYGAFTNKSGFYAIPNIKPGEYTVVVSMIGYQPVEEKITLKPGQALRKEFKIGEGDVVTEEVVVSAKKDEDKRQISISKINVPVARIKEIKIGGESDVFRTLQLLPGVLSSSQISSGLYVRGGSPDQTLVLLDGSTVYNPSHLFGFISTFNTDAIKDVEIIKGGYPAEFGGRMSAVVNITQKDGNKEEFEGIASLGLLSSKLSLQGPVGNGSWFIGGRKSYMEYILNELNTSVEDPLPIFGFYDLNAKIEQDFGDDHKLFLSGFLSRDDLDFGASGIDLNMHIQNRTASLRWQWLAAKNAIWDMNFTTSNYVSGFRQDLSEFLITVENKITDYNLKGNIEIKNVPQIFEVDEITTKFGFEITKYIFHFENNFTGQDREVEEGESGGGVLNIKPEDWTYNLFGQFNYTIHENLSIQAGLRGNYWQISDIATLDPRMALRYQINDVFAIKGAWGVFHQYLKLASLPNFSFFDTWLPTDSTIGVSKATHYILTLEAEPSPTFELAFDAYYKDLTNVHELDNTNLEGDDVAEVFYSGNGEAFGIEIYAQKKIGKLTGWIGYGLGWVNTKFDSINNGNWFRPKYDRRHDLKVVANYKLNDTWSFGGQFVFQTGQSYTGATSRIQTMLPGGNYGQGLILPTDKYAYRMPETHYLNLNTAYSFETFGAPSRLVLDIYNVYSRRDILMRIYQTTDDKTVIEDIELLPIIPTISYEIKF